MSHSDRCPVQRLASHLDSGDVVFIRVAPKPFREVAQATGAWTNHVGIVIGRNATEPLVAESTFPRARITPLAAFVGRSEAGRVAVYRLKDGLTEQQRDAVREAALQRLGTFYDTGFNLHSRRQFCSRYVREVLHEATGVQVGEVQNFSTLLSLRPETNIRFWRLWFLGRIPWTRETVSPASILQCTALRPVFDGHAETQRHFVPQGH